MTKYGEEPHEYKETKKSVGGNTCYGPYLKPKGYKISFNFLVSSFIDFFDENEQIEEHSKETNN